MIYTLDANFLIDAARIHFHIEENTDFWDWMLHLGEKKTVGVSTEVYEEIKKGKDSLANWLDIHKKSLVHNTTTYLSHLAVVMKTYGSLDETVLEKLGADPYVIAHAIENQGIVVTREIPNNATAPHNKKVSSICIELNIPYYTFSRFMWEVRDTMPSKSTRP